MKFLLAVLALAAVLAALAVAALVQLVIELLPYLGIGALVWLVVRHRTRRRGPAPGVAGAPVAPRAPLPYGPPKPPAPAAPMPAYGWVLVPLWPAPPVAHPVVIDAEVGGRLP